MAKRKFSENEDSESMSNSENEMLSNDEERSLNHITNDIKLCVENDSGEISASSNDICEQKNKKYLKSCQESSDEDEVISYSSSKKKKSKHLQSDITDSDDEIILSELKKTTCEKKFKALSSQNNQGKLSVQTEFVKNVEIPNWNVKSKEVCTSTDEDSLNDVPFTVKPRKTKRQLKASKTERHDMSSDEEPLNEFAEAKSSILSSSSDDESFAVKNGISSNPSKIENEESKLEENDSSISSDEEKPISRIVETSIKKDISKENSVSCSSDDEPLAVKSRISANSQRSKKDKGKKLRMGDRNSLSDEDEPISKLSKTTKMKGKPKKSSILSSSSDDESFAVKNGISSNRSKNENEESTLEENDSSISSDEEKAIGRIVQTSKKKDKSKENSVSCSSDDEPLAVKSQKSANSQRSKKDKGKKLKMDDRNSLSDEDEPISKLSNTTKMKGKPKKSQNSSDDRVEHIKKYVRVAGIHIKSYDKLFEGCKSVKSKAEKLINILHEKGLKGRPTLEKCKKLKKKIETKKEIAELDTSNIIKTEGRPKRGTNIVPKSNQSSPAQKRFRHLKDIIDSEESD